MNERYKFKNSKYKVTVTLFFGAAICLSAQFLIADADAASFDEIKTANAGENIDLYEVFNMSGDLTVKIVSEDGKNCLTSWWIKMGINHDIGKHCGIVNYSFSAPLVYMKLRAGHFSSKTLLFIKYGKADISVSVGFDENMKFDFFVVDGHRYKFKYFNDLYEVGKMCGSNINCWTKEANKRINQ